MYRATSQRQARSLDNIVENPDHWRFNDKFNNANNNSHLIFINESNNSVSTGDVGASNNSCNEILER